MLCDGSRSLYVNMENQAHYARAWALLSGHRRQHHRQNLTATLPPRDVPVSPPAPTHPFLPSSLTLDQIGNMCHVSHPLLAPDGPTGREGQREKGKISIGPQSVVGYGMHLSGGSSMSGRSAVSAVGSAHFVFSFVLDCMCVTLLSVNLKLFFSVQPVPRSHTPPSRSTCISSVFVVGPVRAVPMRGLTLFRTRPPQERRKQGNRRTV